MIKVQAELWVAASAKNLRSITSGAYPWVFIAFLAAAAEPGSSFSTLGFLSFLTFVELSPS
jgi:hypothetical protein